MPGRRGCAIRTAAAARSHSCLADRHPFNCEPPPDALMKRGWLTPTSLHYVRNHGPVPRRDWGGHTVSIGGLVDTPRTFTMDELVALPSVTIVCTLVREGCFRMAFFQNQSSSHGRTGGAVHRHHRLHGGEWGTRLKGDCQNIEMSSCIMDELVALPSVTIACTMVSRGRPQWFAFKRAFQSALVRIALPAAPSCCPPAALLLLPDYSPLDALCRLWLRLCALWTLHWMRIHWTAQQSAVIEMHFRPTVQACTGDRRKEQNMVTKTKGFSWGLDTHSH